MKDKKKEEKTPQNEKVKELNLDDLEAVSGGGDNPFKDVPRVTNYDYDDTIKGKI